RRSHVRLMVVLLAGLLTAVLGRRCAHGQVAADVTRSWLLPDGWEDQLFLPMSPPDSQAYLDLDTYLQHEAYSAESMSPFASWQVLPDGLIYRPYLAG